MSTITIRNISEAIVSNIKKVAKQHGCSMEQEVRSFLERQYVSKRKILNNIERGWKDFHPIDPEKIDEWIEDGR